MITQERKSKYKHKVIVPHPEVWGERKDNDMRDWCTQSFGQGGRSKKYRWRFGWTAKETTFYFKNSKDAMMFILRWSA